MGSLVRSIGVQCCVLLSALKVLIFAWKIALSARPFRKLPLPKTYADSGQLFFGTTCHFIQEFAYDSDPDLILPCVGPIRSLWHSEDEE